MSKKTRNAQQTANGGAAEAEVAAQGEHSSETESVDVVEETSIAVEVTGSEPTSANEAETAETVEESSNEEVGKDSDPQPDPVELLEAEVSRKEAEIVALTDRLARQIAEFQNYRRRTEDDLKRSVNFGKEEVVRNFLDIFDDLKRSLDAAETFGESNEETPEMAALHSGVKLVFKKFSDQLQRMGVEQIESEGKQFDENHHEALMQQPAPENVEPGTVLTELQRGYKIGDRILRHAKVIVAGHEDSAA